MTTLARITGLEPGAGDININGVAYNADGNGNVVLPMAIVQAIALLGLTHQIISTPTTDRPTVGTYAGMAVYDTTLDKPIWRNHTDSGWVFADGTSA